MCGIVGFVGKPPAGKGIGALLEEGLEKLEYRGYDSCGIAVAQAGKAVTLAKAAGRIRDVAAEKGFSSLPEGESGIAHTRWATHGGVTDANAHPHTDCAEGGKATVAVAHNGIIENYQELRSALEKRGHKLLSQTDTEVIPHLIEEKLEQGKPFPEAARRTALELEGSYAFIAICSREPGEVFAARDGNPLIIGVAPTGNFIASDATPFLEYTKKVVFLEDGEAAVLKASGIEITNIKTGKAISRAATETNWTAEQAEKGEYAHFMLKEINEQPASAKAALAQDGAALEQFARGIRNAKKVVITACGTARHAGLVTRYAMENVAGKHCEVIISSEYSYFAGREDGDTVVLAVSQSGETADVLDGVKKAKARGAKVYSIVNVAGSTLDRLSDARLYTNCGPEIGVAATKTFTSQVVVGILVAYAMAGKLAEGRKILEELPAKISETIKLNNERTKSIAAKIAKNGNHAYYIARGINFAVALEGALKMKEISYVHAEGMPAGELKHGTIALVEKGTPVIAINPSDYTHAETLSNAVETKARGAWLIGVSDKQNSVYDEWIRVPKSDGILYPVLCAVPLQLLAYHAAVARGHDPDKPRNLAKSVTVK